MKHENQGTYEMVAGEAGVGTVASTGEAGNHPESTGQRPDKGSRLKPLKPEVTSITFTGMGRRDGADIDNSMDLVTFYRLMLQK